VNLILYCQYSFNTYRSSEFVGLYHQRFSPNLWPLLWRNCISREMLKIWNPSRNCRVHLSLSVCIFMHSFLKRISLRDPMWATSFSKLVQKCTRLEALYISKWMEEEMQEIYRSLYSCSPCPVALRELGLQTSGFHMTCVWSQCMIQGCAHRMSN
jgi:hypothetical protein